MGIVNKAINFVLSPIGTIIGGKVGKVMQGASLILASVLTGNPAFAMAGLSRIASAFTKKPKVSPAAANRLHATLDPNAPRTIVFGRTAMATDVRYQCFTGNDQEYYHQVVVVAAHEVEAIEEIWFDSELAWKAVGGAQGKFAGYLTVTPRLVGTSANGIAIDGVWTAACTLTGCAYFHARYKLTGNSKKAESPFAQAIPTRVTVRGKGMKVYDPRFDSTAGGSGPMRATDQATWAWSYSGIEIGRNPACQETTYNLGWRINGKLSVGRGIPAARLDAPSRITSANLCDESVAIAAGGTEPRYRSDGIWSEADAPSSVLGAIRASMNAEPTDASGKMGLRVDYNDLASPVMTLSEADILDGDSWVPSPPLDQFPNVVRGRFTDPSNGALYQMLPAPDVKLASADGIDRFEPGFDLANVQSPSQWQRLAKMRLQRKQYQGLFSARFDATAWGLSFGDVVSFNYAPLGWVAKKFRVVRPSLSLDGSVAMALRETDESIYSWMAEDKAAVVPATPTVYDPTKSPLVQAVDEASKTAEWDSVADPTGKKPSDNADVTANSQVVVIRPPDVTKTANYDGTWPADTFPFSLAAPTVTKGGGNIRTLNNTTYAVSASSSLAGQVAVDNANASASKGVVTINGGLGTSGYVDLIVTVDGIAQPAQRIFVSRETANAPTSQTGSGGTGGTGGTGNKSGDVTFTGSNHSTSYLLAGVVVTVTKAAGETIRCNLAWEYSCYLAAGNGSAVGSARFQYAPAGTGSWTDMGGTGGVAGTAALWNAADQSGETGGLSLAQSVAPSDGDYDVRLLIAKTSGNARLNTDSGSFAVRVGV